MSGDVTVRCGCGGSLVVPGLPQHQESMVVRFLEQHTPCLTAFVDGMRYEFPTELKTAMADLLTVVAGEPQSHDEPPHDDEIIVSREWALQALHSVIFGRPVAPQ